MVQKHQLTLNKEQLILFIRKKRIHSLLELWAMAQGGWAHPFQGWGMCRGWTFGQNSGIDDMQETPNYTSQQMWIVPYSAG